MLFIIQANDTIPTFLSILRNCELNVPSFNWASHTRLNTCKNTIKLPKNYSAKFGYISRLKKGLRN